MILLLLGAGASHSAGYPVGDGLLTDWHTWASDQRAVLHQYQTIGISGSIASRYLTCLAEGYDALSRSGCKTPDQFANHFPTHTDKLLNIKRGLAALFLLHDSHFNGITHFNDYYTLCSIIFNPQYAPNRNMARMLETTPYRIVTYNYDRALYLAAAKYLSDVYGGQYKDEQLASICQLDCSPVLPNPRGAQFDVNKFSLLPFHGSFLFTSGTEETPPFIGATPRDLSANAQSVIETPPIHFPSEVPLDSGDASSSGIGKHAGVMRAQWLSMAPSTNVIIPIGFSFHTENWPFLLTFISKIVRARPPTVSLVCQFKELDKLKSRVQVLFSAASYSSAQVSYLGTFQEFLGTEVAKRPLAKD